MQALIFIIQTLFDLYTITFIVRAILHFVRADFYNPLSQFIATVTSPVLKPLRTIVPSVGRMDTASILMVLVLVALKLAILATLRGRGIELPVLALGAIFGALQAVLQLYFFALIIYVILSWVAPHTNNPASAMLSQIVEPVLRPIRRVIPVIGGLDLSVLVAIIAVQALMLLLGGR